jgi:hypothetical protein
LYKFVDEELTAITPQSTKKSNEARVDQAA